MTPSAAAAKRRATDKLRAQAQAPSTERTLKFLVELNRRLRFVANPDETMSLSARMLGEHLQADRCAYAEVEADENHVTVVGDYVRDVPSIVGRYELSAFGSECLRLHRAGEAYVVDDAFKDPRVTEEEYAAYKRLHVRAVISVPLLKDGKLVAGIAVHKAVPHRWTPDEIELVTLVVGRSWDCIERTRTERALRESEERLRMATESAAIGTWDFNPVTGELVWSDRLKELFGLPPDAEVTFESYLARVHPADREELQAGIERAMRGEGPAAFRIEHRTVPVDGKERWILGMGQVMFEGVGAIRRAVRFVGTSVDITDRKAAENALDRVHLKRLRNMLERMPLGAIALDKDNRIFEANEQVCRLFGLGCTRDSLVGMREEQLRELLLPVIDASEEYVKRHKGMRDALRKELGVEVPLRDGRTLLRDFIPIHENGEYHGFLLLYRDVTQERRTDRAKSEFMSLASHQLRTPLTAIRWSYGRLEKAWKEGDGAAAASLIAGGKASVARMAETIEAMLRISQLESGHAAVRAEAVELEAFLDKLARRNEEAIVRKRLTVRIECPAHLAPRTDETLLRELLENLLSNAVKYSREGGTVTLRAWEEEGEACIDVVDDGLGIPGHQQEKIFTKFFRGENVVARDEQGTGLGLYLVSLITGLLGGVIAFSSKEGEGTTFTLRLPLHRA